MKKIEINHNDVFPFVNITPLYGRAEFLVCPIYKRRKLIQLYIYLLQQQNTDYYYYWECDANYGKINLFIQSYQDLAAPKIWKMFYHKEHKTQSIELYVPTGANFLWFQVYTDSININFLKTKI